MRYCHEKMQVHNLKWLKVSTFTLTFFLKKKIVLKSEPKWNHFHHFYFHGSWHPWLKFDSPTCYIFSSWFRTAALFLTFDENAWSGGELHFHKWSFLVCNVIYTLTYSTGLSFFIHFPPSSWALLSVWKSWVKDLKGYF